MVQVTGFWDHFTDEVFLDFRHKLSVLREQQVKYRKMISGLKDSVVGKEKDRSWPPTKIPEMDLEDSQEHANNKGNGEEPSSQSASHILLPEMESPTKKRQ